MTEPGWTALQHRLLMRYQVFKKRLTHYLGSADLAGDALQDTWLRLERGGDLSTVRSPDTYLFSMAINIALDHMRSENRRLTTSEVATLLDLADEAPDAARTVEARSDLDALVAIIEELPVRQQAILLAARIGGMPRDDIARRFGVSVRFVQRELQEAHDYCASRLEKLTREQFRSGPRETSTDRKPLRTIARKPKMPGTAEE
jgi:RNA polymerase sigma-70 factor (ECF subfamily)